MNESLDKGVSAAVDALKQSPVMLAFVILQSLTIVSLLYLAIVRQAAITTTTSELNKLIDKCVDKLSGASEPGDRS